MFGTDLGWGVDDLLNQPCEVAEKSLEGRNQFFKKKIKIVSVKTIFAFFDCDSQGLPETAIYVGRGRGEPGRTYPNTMGWYPKSNVYMNS